MVILLSHSSSPRCAFFVALIGRTARGDGSPRVGSAIGGKVTRSPVCPDLLAPDEESFVARRVG
jgi:hypothetical protein